MWILNSPFLYVRYIYFSDKMSEFKSVVIVKEENDHPEFEESNLMKEEKDPLEIEGS